MRKHECLSNPADLFVLILNNADFLWAAKVAKTASLCTECVYVCGFGCLSTSEVKPGWLLLHGEGYHFEWA